jgi:molybdopterin molybdotransferase
MKSALTVDEALASILAGTEPTPGEEVALLEASNRTLAEPLTARLTQPPFDASAMDGYAVRKDDVTSLPATLDIIGDSAAGHPFAGTIAPGQAVRIFTGAPLPVGSDAVVIQENTERNGDTVRITEGSPDPGHVRPSGGDFSKGQQVIAAGTQLLPRHIALAAAMGHSTLKVHRKPVVAILATGDELVEPGTTPGPGQIVASNSYALAAMVESAGGSPQLLGIASDTLEDLRQKLEQAAGADVVVTIGGASVGDHDLVGKALTNSGFELDFWKIAMRPGKPLMFAQRLPQRAVGVPGNPVSAIVCAHIFVLPLIASLSGRRPHDTNTLEARLTVPLERNGPRQHYMRASLARAADGDVVTPAESQDSSLLSILARSNALIVRPPGAAALGAGEKVTVLPIGF